MSKSAAHKLCVQHLHPQLGCTEGTLFLCSMYTPPLQCCNQYIAIVQAVFKVRPLAAHLCQCCQVVQRLSLHDLLSDAGGPIPACALLHASLKWCMISADASSGPGAPSPMPSLQSTIFQTNTVIFVPQQVSVAPSCAPLSVPTEPLSAKALPIPLPMLLTAVYNHVQAAQWIVVHVHVDKHSKWGSPGQELLATGIQLLRSLCFALCAAYVADSLSQHTAQLHI